MILSSSCFLALTSLMPVSDDWPQYNGAGSDRHSAETIRLKRWPWLGPPTRWKVDTQAGYSSFTVSDGRVFTLVQEGGVETLLALDGKSGSKLWATGMSEVDYDGGGDAGTWRNSGGDGPRSTPSVDGDHVFVLDGNLALHCFDTASGKRRWRRDVRARHDGQDIRWQNAASPLVEGDHVFVCGGGPGQTFLAFKKKTGCLAWSTGDERMTHATPVAATLHGKRQILFYVQSGLVALDPKHGDELWRASYRYRISSAASPVVYEDIVYLSAGYGVGGGAFRINKTSKGWKAELLWQKRNKLMNHWSTPVCRDGYLYGMFGFKKYGKAPLCCVNIETGETLWSEPGFGPGNVIAVGDILVALSDDGDVVLAELSPKRYRELARDDVLDGKCWSSPSFSGGALYVRSTEEGACIDLR